MLKALLDRLTYANVVATLALVVAVGTGGAYAASKIDGAAIRKHSLTGKQIKANSIGGKQIKERSLSPVPRARNAALLAGQPAARYILHCPEGMVPVSDVCFETQPRPPLPYGSAAVACEGTDNKVHPGRRLPTHDELMTAIGDFNMQLAPGGELTSNVYPSSNNPGDPLNVLYIIGGAGSAAITSDTAAGAKSFRCVADPVN